MFGAKPSQYGHSGGSPFLQQGLSSGRAAGGLGRTVLNILGGAEDDPSRYIGMDMLKRGKSQAKNPGGLGKTVVRTAIKSYLGAGLGALGDIGTVSDVASAAGEVSEAASAAGEVSEAASAADTASDVASAADKASDATSAADKVAEGADPARDPMFALKNMVGGAAVGVKNVLGGPTPAEGVRGAVQDFITQPRGAVMDFITQQTGIPIGGQAIVGKLGEAMNFDPQDIRDVQTLMAQRDPQRKYGNVNQAMAPNEYLQPPPVPSNASRQINRQGGVRNLVAQRFGEGSPITKYIGSYDVPGTYVAQKDERIMADVARGETVAFGGDPQQAQVTPQKVYPDFDGPGRRPTTAGGSWTDYPEGAGSAHGDVHVPNARGENKFQTGLGWFSYFAGKLLGDTPWDKAANRKAWNFKQDASEAIMNARLQRGYEGKAGRTDYPGYIREQNALDSLREAIGIPQSGVMQRIGEERDRVIGTMPDGRPKTVRERFGVGPEGGVRWQETPGGFTGGMTNPIIRPPRKVYMDAKGNSGEGAGPATHYRMSYDNPATGKFDEPIGPPIPIGLSTADTLRAEKNAEHNSRTLSIARTYLARMGKQDASGEWSANTDFAAELSSDPNNNAFAREVRQLERVFVLQGFDLKPVGGQPPSAEDQAIMDTARRVYNAIKKQQGPDPNVKVDGGGLYD